MGVDGEQRQALGHRARGYRSRSSTIRTPSAGAAPRTLRRSPALARAAALIAVGRRRRGVRHGRRPRAAPADVRRSGPHADDDARRRSPAAASRSTRDGDDAGRATASRSRCCCRGRRARAIDARFTCDGDDVSPPLSWTGAPAGTVELALLVTDDDADGFVHWAVAGIAPASGRCVEGAGPPGAVAGAERLRRAGWSGPCPPAGSPHTYRFTLYALNQQAEVPDDIHRRRPARGHRRPHAARHRRVTGTYATPVTVHPSVRAVGVTRADLAGIDALGRDSVVERDAVEVRRRTSRSPRRGASGRARSAGRSAR